MIIVVSTRPMFPRSTWLTTSTTSVAEIVLSAASMAPVAQESVTLQHPDGRVDAGLLERRGHGQMSCRGRCRAAPRGLLLVCGPSDHRAPAGRRLGVADIAGSHGVEDRLRDRVDTLGVLTLVAVDRRISRQREQSVGDIRSSSAAIAVELGCTCAANISRAS